MQNDTSLAETHLTFGVEIEFLLATLPAGTEDPHEHDDRQVYGIATPRRVGWDVRNREPNKKAYRHIAETLHEAGIPVHRDQQSYFFSLEEPKVGEWILKDDITLTEDSIEGYPYELVAVEIVSPPFHFTEDAITQIEAVCETLTNNYRIVYSGGLHVHVGNKTKGFSGAVLQRLLATLWTFDTALEWIHSRDRVRNKYCVCLRKQSNLQKRLEASGMNNRKVLEELLDKRFPTDAALWQYVLNISDNSIERGAYNFRNLNGVDDKKTIEFRMHESTLDGPAIRNWIQVCVGLVDFALINNSLLAPFLLASIDHDEFDVCKLLKAANMGPQMLYYGAKDQALKAAFENEIYVNMDKVEIATPSRPQITTVDINSCASYFIWASEPERLIGCHAYPGDPGEPNEHNIEEMVHRTAEKAQNCTVRAIAIVCHDDPYDGDTKKAELEFNKLFPAIRVISREYTLDEPKVMDREGDENEEGVGHWIHRNEPSGGVEFWMSANISSPGKVEMRYRWYGGRHDGRKDPQFAHNHTQRVWV